MKKQSLLLFLVWSVFLVTGFKKEVEPQAPANLIKNGDMEGDPLTNWVNGYGYSISSNPNGYLTGYTSEAAASGTRLEISQAWTNGPAPAYRSCGGFHSRMITCRF